MSEQKLNSIEYILPINLRDIYDSPMVAALRETVWNAMNAEKRCYGEVRNVMLNLVNVSLPQYGIADIVVTVSDTGDGMTEEELLQRFIPYTVEGNHFVGCGSKSPLLVARSMDVYTRRQGGSVTHVRIERDPSTGELGYTTPNALGDDYGSTYVNGEHGTTITFSVPDAEKQRAALANAAQDIQVATAGCGVTVNNYNGASAFQSDASSRFSKYGLSQYDVYLNRQWGYGYSGNQPFLKGTVDALNAFPELGSINVDGVECRISIIGRNNIAVCLLRDNPGMLVRCGSWIYPTDECDGHNGRRPLHSYLDNIGVSGYLNETLPLVLVDVPEELLGFSQSKDRIVGSSDVLRVISDAVREHLRVIRSDGDAVTRLLGSVEYEDWQDALMHLIASPFNTCFQVSETCGADDDGHDGSVHSYEMRAARRSGGGSGYAVNLCKYAPHFQDKGETAFNDILRDPLTLSYLMTRDNTGHFKVRSNVAACDGVAGAIADIISNRNNAVTNEHGEHVLKQSPSKAERKIDAAGLPLRIARMFADQWQGARARRTILVDARLCSDVVSVRRALPNIVETFEIEEHAAELAVMVVVRNNVGSNPRIVETTRLGNIVNGVGPRCNHDAANNVNNSKQQEMTGAVEEHSEASAMGEHTSCIESPCQYMVDGTTTKMLVERSLKNRRSGDSRRLEECRKALVDAAFAYDYMSKTLHPLFTGSDNIPFDNKDGCSDAPLMIKDTIDKGLSPVLDEATRGDVNECLWMLQQTNEGSWWLPTHPDSVRKYDIDGILEHIVSGEIHAAMVVVPTMGRSKKLAGVRALSVAFAADALGLHSFGNMSVVIGTSDVHLNAKRVAALRDIGVEIVYDHTGELVPDAVVPSEMFSFEFNGDVDSLPARANVFDDVLKPTYHGEVPEWVFNYYRSIRATEWITGLNGVTWITHCLSSNNKWKQYALVLPDYVRRGRVAMFTSLGADWANQWRELIENHPQIYYDNAVEHNATLLRGISIPAVDDDVKRYIDTFCCYCCELGNVWAPACERFRIHLDFGFHRDSDDVDEMMENIVDIADTLGITEQVREVAALDADEVLRRVEERLGVANNVEAAAASNYFTA